MRKLVLHLQAFGHRYEKAGRTTAGWIVVSALLGLALSGCGKSGVNLDNAPYVPKIVVEGYLYCGQTVSHIKLMRNFPIGSPVDTSGLYLTPSGNDVHATINGTALSFDPATQTYFSDQINVGYGKTYTLEVHAKVDGSSLQTTSTTTTPEKGFRLTSGIIGSYPYDSPFFVLGFVPSPGTSFYAFSIVPDSASTNNFIYNNLFRRNLDSADVAKRLNDFKFQGVLMDGINSYSSGPFVLHIRSNETWFYGKYTVVAYAGDTNFKDYVMTAPSVQEADGNFHEPILIFKGNGIGVFASAIADTATFTVTR